LLKNYKILLILGLIFLAGCDLFTTRTVEPPEDPRSNFTPPTSYDIVLQNLQFAIAEKNLNNYMSCFVDTGFSSTPFKFNADIESLIQYPNLSNWDINKERTYYTNLLSLTDIAKTSTLFFSNEQVFNSLDSAVYDSDYLLVFNHSRETVAKQVRGKLRFTLVPNNNNFWAIQEWYDFKNNSEDTTWSVLKAGFAN
jgi:hypothetical protein